MNLKTDNGFKPSGVDLLLKASEVLDASWSRFDWTECGHSGIDQLIRAAEWLVSHQLPSQDYWQGEDIHDHKVSDLQTAAPFVGRCSSEIENDSSYGTTTCSKRRKKDKTLKTYHYTKQRWLNDHTYILPKQSPDAAGPVLKKNLSSPRRQPVSHSVKPKNKEDRADDGKQSKVSKTKQDRTREWSDAGGAGVKTCYSKGTQVSSLMRVKTSALSTTSKSDSDNSHGSSSQETHKSVHLVCPVTMSKLVPVSSSSGTFKIVQVSSAGIASSSKESTLLLRQNIFDKPQIELTAPGVPPFKTQESTSPSSSQTSPVSSKTSEQVSVICGTSASVTNSMDSKPVQRVKPIRRGNHVLKPCTRSRVHQPASSRELTNRSTHRQLNKRLQNGRVTQVRRPQSRTAPRRPVAVVEPFLKKGGNISVIAQCDVQEAHQEKGQHRNDRKRVKAKDPHFRRRLRQALGYWGPILSREHHRGRKSGTAQV